MSVTIVGEELFEEKTSQFNTRASLSRFRKDYLAAVNDALSEMEVNLDTSFSDIGDTQTDILVNSKMERAALKAGIDYYVVVRGNFSSGDLNLVSARTAFERAQERAMAKRDLDATAAADDEETIADIS